MKIGIDARLIQESGVGRYIRNLVKYLQEMDRENDYVVFLSPESYDSFKILNDRWTKRKIAIRWHTLAEQIILPFLFLRECLDVLHVPYFTVPLLYPRSIVTTIHDLTILKMRTGKASTRLYPLYLAKWLAYCIVLWIGVKKARIILTVSQTVKKDIVKTFHVPERKIIVTCEGIDDVFKRKINRKRYVQSPYFLYVGNVYPHKNAELLIRSYKLFSEKEPNAPLLVFVGKNDFFYERLKMMIRNLGMQSHVLFYHDVADDDLSSMYANACALVFPSKHEGFGLPALEALYHHVPVIVSDIPVFRELLDPYALFVKHDEYAWVEAFRTLSRGRYRMQKIPSSFFDRFDWKKLAELTKTVYESCACV